MSAYDLEARDAQLDLAIFQRDEARARLAEVEAERDDAVRAHGAAVGTGQIYERAHKELAAENARLRQENAACPARPGTSGYVHISEIDLAELAGAQDAVKDLADLLDEARTQAKAYLARLERYDGEAYDSVHARLDTATRNADELRKQRDEARAGNATLQRDLDIALAAALHMRPVVEAAQAWRELVGDYPNPASHRVGDLIAAVDAYRAGQKGPETAPGSPLRPEEAEPIPEWERELLDRQRAAETAVSDSNNQPLTTDLRKPAYIAPDQMQVSPPKLAFADPPGLDAAIETVYVDVCDDCWRAMRAAMPDLNQLYEATDVD